MTNYEKAKSEGIKNWEDAMVEVSDDRRYTYTLNFLSSFAEKIKEALIVDIVEMIKIEGMEHKLTPFQSTVNTYIKNRGEEIKKLLASDSQNPPSINQQ